LPQPSILVMHAMPEIDWVSTRVPCRNATICTMHPPESKSAMHFARLVEPKGEIWTFVINESAIHI
jgi:hypothetical protein